MKRKLMCMMLAGSLLVAGTAQGVSAVNLDEIVIPEYTTAEYDVDFVTTLDGIDDLKAPCDEQGSIVSLTYEAPAYAVNEFLDKEETMEKTVNIYLPYGYDETQQYDILYLLHGTGGSENYWLYDNGDTTCNVLDNMIAQGLCDPLIVVTPNYYAEIKGKEFKITDEMVAAYAEETDDAFMASRNDLWTQYFQYELRNDIIPLVESNYVTYAGGDTSEESLIASRDHRALAGLSRGAMTTARSGLMANADIISWFGNYSGVWAVFEQFKTALAEKYKDYPIHYWYNGNGTADFSVENHVDFHNQVTSELTDVFTDGENYAFVMKEEGAHAYENWIVDLYDSLLVFFK